MSELVKKGIEQAQSDLRKESDEQLWQEGILRHVPLVGSVYNWFSPAQKVTFLDFHIWNDYLQYSPLQIQIKGRTLSLNDGKMQTTEEIYKAPPHENGLPEKNVSEHQNNDQSEKAKEETTKETNDAKITLEE